MITFNDFFPVKYETLMGSDVMRKKDDKAGLLIDDFSPLLNALKNGQSKINNQQSMEREDSGVDYATEYRKQTGKDLETGEYVTQ